MNTIRMIAIALPMMLLLACGGGGSSTATPVPLETLPDFTAADVSTAQTRFSGTVPTSMTPSTIIREIQTRATNADSWFFTIARPITDINPDAMPETCTGNSCSLTLPNVGAIAFSLTDVEGLSLIDDTNLERFNSESQAVMVDEGVTMIQSRTAARQSDGTQLAFQTYGGWLDNNVFGVERITITENGTTNTHLAGFSFGDAPGTNPTGSGRAEWRGVFVGHDILTDNSLQGNVVIDIDDLSSPNVDIAITGVLVINSTSSSTDAFRWEDLILTGGTFNDANGHVRGVFYGEEHNQVGGIVDNREIVGAFGGTRE